MFLDRGRVALGRGLDFGAPGDGFVRVTIGTSSTLLAGIVDRMAAAAASLLLAENPGTHALPRRPVAAVAKQESSIWPE